MIKNVKSEIVCRKVVNGKGKMSLKRAKRGERVKYIDYSFNPYYLVFEEYLYTLFTLFAIKPVFKNKMFIAFYLESTIDFRKLS